MYRFDTRIPKAF